MWPESFRIYRMKLLNAIACLELLCLSIPLYCSYPHAAGGRHGTPSIQENYLRGFHPSTRLQPGLHLDPNGCHPDESGRSGGQASGSFELGIPPGQRAGTRFRRVVGAAGTLTMALQGSIFRGTGEADLRRPCIASGLRRREKRRTHGTTAIPTGTSLGKR